MLINYYYKANKLERRLQRTFVLANVRFFALANEIRKIRGLSNIGR